MLVNINPSTLFAISSNEIGLVNLSPDVLVPLLSLSCGKHGVLKEEKKRWLSANALLAGESSLVEEIVQSGYKQEICYKHTNSIVQIIFIWFDLSRTSLLPKSLALTRLHHSISDVYLFFQA